MKLAALISFSILSLSIFGQQKKILLKRGDELARSGIHYGASHYYQQAFDLDSSDIQVMYKLAHSYVSWNAYDKAGFYFNKIVGRDKSGRVFKDAWFQLASMQKYNGDYKNALKSLKKAKSIYKKQKKSYEYLKVLQEVKSCSYALRTYRDSIPGVAVKNMGPAVNTTASEFGGAIYLKNLFYSSLRADSMNNNLEVVEGKYEISILRQESVLKEAKKLDSIINSTGYHNANFTYDSILKKAFFSRCDSLTGCNIYTADYDGKRFSNVKICSSKINAPNSSNTQPNVGHVDDKHYLFFTSSRSGGEGQLDIWFAEILNGQHLAPPKTAVKK